MRKDYREPDDFEYEPDSARRSLKRATEHQAARPASRIGGRRMSVMELERPENGTVPHPMRRAATASCWKWRWGRITLDHGVFRMDVALGWRARGRLRPVFGYLHRNHEEDRRGAKLPGLNALPPTGLDYICPITTTGPTRWPWRSDRQMVPSAPSTCG